MNFSVISKLVVLEDDMVVNYLMLVILAPLEHLVEFHSCDGIENLNKKQN